jgi:hypothetical protein
MNFDYVKRNLIYWAQVQAAGLAFDVQNGPGALTVGIAASVYTITMPANFTVPLNRRSVVLTSRGSAALHTIVQLDEAASAANTVVVRTFAAAAAAAPAAANVAFICEIHRMLFAIGAGAG